MVGNRSPHCRNEFNPATLSRNITALSYVCVGEPFNEYENYTVGSCRRKWKDHYGALGLHGRAWRKLLTRGILLRAVESGVHIKESMTVTEKKAYWVIQSSVKEVPYASVRLTNFEGRKGSLTKLTSPQSTSTCFAATISFCKGAVQKFTIVNRSTHLVLQDG